MELQTTTDISNNTEEEEYKEFIPSEYTKNYLNNPNWSIANELSSYEPEVEKAGFIEGLGIGLKTSILGTLGRKVQDVTGYVTGDQYYPKDNSEQEEIFKVVGYDMAKYSTALAGATSMDEVRANLKRMQEDDKALNKLNNSSWWVSIPGNLASVAGDPLMLASILVPASTSIKLGSRLATFAARAGTDAAVQVPLALLNEGQKEIISGREGDYWGQAAMITAASSAFAGISVIGKGAIRRTLPMVDGIPDEYGTLARLKLSRDTARDELNKAYSTLSSTTKSFNKYKVDYDLANKRYKDYIQEAKKLKASIKPTEDKLASYKELISKTETEIAESTAKSKALKEEATKDTVSTKVKRAKLKEKSLLNKKRADTKLVLEKLKKEQASLEKSFKVNSDNLSKYKAGLSDLNKYRKQVGNNLKDLSLKLEPVNKDFKLKQERIKQAQDEYESARKLESLRQNIPYLTEEEYLKAAKAKNIDVVNPPIDDAIENINVSAATKSTVIHNSRLDVENKPLDTNVTSEQAQQFNNVQEAASKATGDSLADTVASNPTLGEKVKSLLANPTKVFDLKAYLASLMDSKNTPDSVKDLINKLVHFEEGVKRADGKYSQYASNAPVYTEINEGFKVADNRYIDKLNDISNKIRLKYSSPEKMDKVNDYIYRKLEDVTVTDELEAAFKDDSLVKSFIDTARESYKQRKGDLVARELLLDTKDVEYAPLVMDLNKIFSFCDKYFPRNDKGAKEFLTNYLIKSINDSSKHRAAMFLRYKEELIESKVLKAAKENKGKTAATINKEIDKKVDKPANFETWLKEKASKAATGYIDQGRSIYASHKLAMSTTETQRRQELKKVLEDYSDFADNFSFLKERLPWNTGYIDSLADGTKFSINDIRADALEAHNKYRARSTGVLTDYDAFEGKTFEQVQEMFFNASNDLEKYNNRNPALTAKLYRNLNMLHKRAYGMSVTENQEAFNILDATSQILRNLAFSSFGSYMALNSLMEVSRALRATSFAAMLKLVPFAGTLFKRWANNGFTKEDLSSIRGYLIGETMRPLLGKETALFHGARKYSEVTESPRFNKFIGKVTGATDYLADHSPAGLLLRYVNTRIDDVFETYALKELVQRAHDVRTKVNKGFMSDKVLKELNVSKEDFNSLLDSIKKYISYDAATGTSKIAEDGLDKLASENPKGVYVLRRLMKNVRETTMQRRNMDDMFMYEKSSTNSLVSLALQFKGFSIQSYRKRFIKSIHQAMNGDIDEVALQYLISASLSGFITLGTVALKSQGLDDEDKERYLESALGVSSMNDLNDSSKLSKFLLNITANRMAELAGISLGLNLVGVGTGTKTTASNYRTGNSDDEGSPFFITSSDTTRTLTNMLPTLRTLQSIISAGTAGVNVATSATGLYEPTYRENRDQGMMINQAISGLPNIPFVTNYIKDYVKDSYNNPYY